MTKGLEPLEALAKIKKHDIHKTLINKKFVMDKEWEENYQIIEKELKALEIVKNNFKLVGNCLHAKNLYVKDNWVFVKEIEDEQELNAWKGILL